MILGNDEISVLNLQRSCISRDMVSSLLNDILT